MANKKVSADIVRTGIGGITIQGDLLYKGASDLERLPKGTAAQVLTMNGGATAPSWGDAAAGGAWTIIGTAVADDSASLTVTGLNSTYDTYAISISDLLPANDMVHLWLRVGDSGGIDSGASDYSHTVVRHNSDSTPSAQPYGDAADSEMELSGGDAIGNNTGEGYGGMLYLHRPGDGTTFPMITGTGMYSKSAVLSMAIQFSGARLSVITLDRILIQMSSGNIASGRLTVWGISHA